MKQVLLNNPLKIARYLWALPGLVLFLGCTNDRVSDPNDWQNVVTVQQLWHKHPNQLRSLFDAINLELPALAPIRSMLAKGDTVAGAERLLEYYRQIDRDWVITTLDSLPYAEALRIASALRSDTIIRQGNSVKIPINPGGGWKWNYTGPDNDDEFGYSLNGNSYLPTLFMAWKKTGITDYVEVFDLLIKDWVTHHPLPASGDSIYMVLDTAQSIDYRDIGEVEWRTLETGKRLGASWPQTFYAFQKEDAFSPATRLLMLSSICKQAAYLRKYHKFGHNWTTMEMNGLALAGLTFPEFRDADHWANYALEVMKNEINRQVYPDGVQTEISTKTQWVALRRFESVANNFLKANRMISESYIQRLEEMYNYLAYSMRPDGHQPLNNDSDRDDLKPRVSRAAKKFDRPDWQWVATNGGGGNVPERDPSVTFPWAGIHIMRNGWDKQANWSFFDAGPYGTGHQHRDKLHLSVTAFGKDLLVDGGRYTHKDYFNFDPTAWRGYFRSSFSHNVILVDGSGQNEGPERMKTALVKDQDYRHHPLYDYAYGTFKDGYEGVEGKATHTRTVLYVRDKYWVVLDHFDTDRPRNLQVLWHYAPDCQVILESTEAVSTNQNEANLRIVPLGNVKWQAVIVKGQEKPVIQGWNSTEFGVKVPNPTIVYSATVLQSGYFAWLLVPSQGPVPNVNAQIREIGDTAILSIAKNDEAVVSITLPLEKDPSKVQIKF